MYVYELARELGTEPRELIECAAAEEMGHFSPNTKLSQEQLLALRECYVRSQSQSRGSLFAGGGRPAAPPPSALPKVPDPQEPPSAGSADPYGSPLRKPIHDPDAAPGGGSAGGPLTFDPSSPVTPLGGDAGGSPPGASAPAAPPPPAEYRWDEPTSWDPLPASTTLGGSSPSASSPTSTLRDYSGHGGSGERDMTDSEYERRFHIEDWAPPKADGPSASRTVVIGVVGLVVIIVVSMVAGRELGIIGPGAERHCLITSSPAESGEGVTEEIVCVDGYGKETSREVRRVGNDSDVVDFGATAQGEVTRVVELDDFCRGSSAFLDFREGFQTEVSAAASMVEIGHWYDENDGFGSAGQSAMVGSFGRAGPNPRVRDLAAYLVEVENAARADSVPQAQLLFAAAEQTYGDRILDVRNFSHGNC